VTTLPVRDLRPELQKPLAEERFGDRRGFSDVLTCRAVLDDVREDAGSASSRSLSTILKGKGRDESAIPRKAGDAAAMRMGLARRTPPAGTRGVARDTSSTAGHVLNQAAGARKDSKNALQIL
jgi:hypothetical protein